MAHLIDKDALVAEIERRISLYKGLSADTVNPNRIDEDEQILSFIDTLEMEEVDLEKEINDYYITKKPTVWFNTLKDIAKHFFEFGLRVNNEKEK